MKFGNAPAVPRNRKWLFNGMIVGALSVSSAANAEYITYVFSGQASASYSGPSTPPPPGEPPPFPMPFPLTELPTGFDSFAAANAQTINGYLTVNTDGTDLVPDPNRGQFSGAAIVPLFYLDIFDETFSFDYRAIQPLSNSFVNTSNNDLPQFPGGLAQNYIDIRGALGTGIFSGPTSSRYSVTLFSIFNTFDTSIINSDMLPSDLTAYGNWYIGLNIYDPVTFASATYSTDVALVRYVPVSEPTTFALVALGLFGIVATQGRRRLRYRVGKVRPLRHS